MVSKILERNPAVMKINILYKGKANFFISQAPIKYPKTGPVARDKGIKIAAPKTLIRL